ncbi:sulfatase [Halobium palmae]|uniref:Sulfatase n=1 Tax=Halobium palmae TaxID=1776492 RepID=A0ABD5RW23_9EURY
MKILHIDIDSLRPDHMGAYGYEQDTTPHIDALVDDGVAFTSAYAANSPCMPSRAGTMSGRYGIHNGVATHGRQGRILNSPHMRDNERYDRSWWQLPELFFNNRVQTVGVSSFPRHPAPWFYHLWHEYYQPQEPAEEGAYFQTPEASEITDIALECLDENLPDDIYLYVQYWNPHTPYTRSKKEVAEFEDPPMPPYPTKSQIEDHLEWEKWRSAAQVDIKSRADLAEVLARYDAEIKHVDKHVGRLIEMLRQNEIYDETLVIVTADHGEEFGENGLYSEHGTVSEGTQRIPLIFKPPAGESTDFGFRNHLTTNVDLAPTIADYCGLEPPATWQGDSLRPIIAGDEIGWRDHIVVEHGLYTAQRAIRTDRWKLVKTYNAGMWGDVIDEIELYDMETDQWEQTDLSADHPEVIERLTADMAVWTEQHEGRQEDALKKAAREGPAGMKFVRDG